MINIIGEYRQQYLKLRNNGADPVAASEASMTYVYKELIQASVMFNRPISQSDLDMLEDLDNNPHYTRLLEDIRDMTNDDQIAYLQRMTKIPSLRLVK